MQPEAVTDFNIWNNTNLNLLLCSSLIFLFLPLPCFISSSFSLHSLHSSCALKSSTVGDECWLAVTELDPQGTLPALWLPDALPGRGNATSTAAAGGGLRLPTNCWQRRRAYLASACRKGLAAWILCVRKPIHLRIMRLNKAPLSASHLLIFLFLFFFLEHFLSITVLLTMSADEFRTFSH